MPINVIPPPKPEGILGQFFRPSQGTSNGVLPPQSNQPEENLPEVIKLPKRDPEVEDQGLIPLQPGFNAPWLPNYLIPMSPAQGPQEAEQAQRQAQAEEDFRSIAESAAKQEELKRKAWEITLRQGLEAAAPPPWQPRPQGGPPAAESVQRLPRKPGPMERLRGLSRGF